MKAQWLECFAIMRHLGEHRRVEKQIFHQRVQPGAPSMRRRGMRIPLPTFSSYQAGFHFAFGEDYFEKLRARRARRWELVREFQQRARKATTKALKAMWTNLSKGQLHHAKKLDKQLKWDRICFFGGYVLFVSVTALAAASILKWVV